MTTQQVPLTGELVAGVPGATINEELLPDGLGGATAYDVVSMFWDRPDTARSVNTFGLITKEEDGTFTLPNEGSTDYPASVPDGMHVWFMALIVPADHAPGILVPNYVSGFEDAGVLAVGPLPVGRLPEAGDASDGVPQADFDAHTGNITDAHDVDGLLARAISELFIGVSISGNVLTFVRHDGGNPRLITLPTGGGGMADGVVVSAEVDAAQETVTVTTSTGDTVQWDLTPLFDAVRGLVTRAQQSANQAQTTAENHIADATQHSRPATGTGAIVVSNQQLVSFQPYILPRLTEAPADYSLLITDGDDNDNPKRLAPSALPSGPSDGAATARAVTELGAGTIAANAANGAGVNIALGGAIADSDLLEVEIQEAGSEQRISTEITGRVFNALPRVIAADVAVGSSVAIRIPRQFDTAFTAFGHSQLYVCHIEDSGETSIALRFAHAASLRGDTVRVWRTT